MRERSVTVKVLYEDGHDDTALVILDKMSDWLIDIDGIIAKETTFHDPKDADPAYWADWLFEGVDDEED